MNYLPWKKTGDYKLSSGKHVNTYWDLKEMMGDPQLLAEEVRRIVRLRKMEDVKIIVGIDYGGVPLAIALSLMTNIPYAVLRKEAKNHGMAKRIEGCQTRGKCLLLDDVKSTGKSMEEAKKYLEEWRYQVIETHVLMERIDV